MTQMLPKSWTPPAQMDRVIAHWTGGAYKANKTDKKHYHVLIEGDGNPVRGNYSIAANESNLTSGSYAAHTLNCNTGSIGVTVCCMYGAKEVPFDPGKYPMTEEQWEAMCQVIAEICKVYGIPVTPETVLSHAEVEETLGIKQRKKWDFTRLPFYPGIKGADACGEKLRADVLSYMQNGRAPGDSATDGLQLNLFRRIIRAIVNWWRSLMEANDEQRTSNGTGPAYPDLWRWLHGRPGMAG